jgi:hypothetical protein
VALEGFSRAAVPLLFHTPVQRPLRVLRHVAVELRRHEALQAVLPALRSAAGTATSATAATRRRRRGLVHCDAAALCLTGASLLISIERSVFSPAAHHRTSSRQCDRATFRRWVRLAWQGLEDLAAACCDCNGSGVIVVVDIGTEGCGSVGELRDVLDLARPPLRAALDA